MVDARFDRVDQRLDSLEAKFDTKIDKKVDEARTSIVAEVSLVIEKRMNQQLRWSIALMGAQLLALLSIAVR